MKHSAPCPPAAAVIVAGGKGVRMGQPVRKQYLHLNGTPILNKTLEAFDACDVIDCIILVTPETDFTYIRDKILSPCPLKKKIMLAPGGSSRQESVYNGLKSLDGSQEIVAIHDAVRPFVTCDQIRACIRTAAASGACIPGIPAFDTLKKTNTSGIIEQTLDRNHIWLAQTPQAFQYHLILKAHERAKADNFTGTDDASLMERLGMPVTMIEGSRFNIKITTPDDLKLAAAFLRL